MLMVRCCTNVFLLHTKTCEALFKNGKKQRFGGVGWEQALLLNNVYKTNVNEEDK